MRMTLLRSFVAAGLMLAASCCFSAKPANTIFTVEVIKQQMSFTSKDIASADVVMQSDKNYGIRVRLNKKASDALYSMTSAYPGSTVNIVNKENKIISSATIQTGLAGEFIVTGFTEKEARAAASQIKS